MTSAQPVGDAAPVADFRRLANGGASRLADTGTSPGLRLV